jgi:hypothetical protein
MDTSGFRASSNIGGAHWQAGPSKQALRDAMFQALQDPNVPADQKAAIYQHLQQETDTWKLGGTRSNPLEADGIGGMTYDVQQGPVPSDPATNSYSPETNPVQAQFGSNIDQLLSGTAPKPNDMNLLLKMMGNQ